MDLRLLPDLPYEAQRELMEACTVQFELAEEVCDGICNSTVRCPFCDAEPWSLPSRHQVLCPVARWGAAKKETRQMIQRLIHESRLGTGA